MIIWKQNRIIPESLRSIIFRRIENIINCSEQKCFYFLGKDDRKIYPDQRVGDILAWPSWLMHGVDKVKDPSINRLVVSGNIALKDYYDNDASFVSRDHGNGHITWDIV